MIGQDYLTARMPKITEVTSVEQVLPAIRKVVKRESRSLAEGLALKPGEHVSMVTDSTLNPFLPQAFEIAIKEAGGTVERIDLEGRPDLTEPIDLVDTFFGNNWLPNSVWERAKAADVFFHLAFIKMAHTPNLPVPRSSKKPRVVEWEVAPDLLLSDWLDFPLELWDFIDEKTWQLLGHAGRLEITDTDGTDFTLELKPEDWGQRHGGEEEDPRLTNKDYLPGHLLIPFPRDRQGVHGSVAIRSLTFGGPVPPTRLTVEGRQVTEVEGGGKFGERLRASFEEHRDDASYASHQPGPGCNWIATFAMCTNPKARRSPAYWKATGSARVHAWTTGHRRAGFIHSSLGSVLLSPTHKNIRHFDIQAPTLKADGRLVIDHGHLVTLDDPAVRRVAERFGDPDRLLTEDWIPNHETGI